VRKTDGWEVWSVDHASRQELVEKYGPDPKVTEWRIGEVDFVWRDGTLENAVPSEHHGSFDACIASHVLEHMPDPIGVLQSLGCLLKPSGVISLAVPDQRFCFDFFKPISTVGELLEARRHQAARHSHNTRFGHRRPVAELPFFESLEAAKRGFDSYGDGPDDPYVDCHAWHFTPSSFELAVRELGALGEIDFSVATASRPWDASST
jgi:SAM-dependent methyltransferase